MTIKTHMTNFERERLAKLMDDKTYFYLIEKFKRVFFYYRSSNDRTLGAYLSMMNENLYLRALVRSYGSNAQKKIEQFEFNEENLLRVRERTTSAFKGVEAFHHFIDFYLDNLKRINFDVNQLILGPVGSNKRNIAKKKAVEIINDSIPSNEKKASNEKKIFDEYNNLLNEKIFFSSFNNTSYSDFIEDVNEDGKIVDGIFKKICRVANNNIDVNAGDFLSKLKDKLKDYFNQYEEEYYSPEETKGKDPIRFKIIDNSVCYSYGADYTELTEENIYKNIEYNLGPKYSRSTFIETLKCLFDGLELNYNLKNPLDKYVLIIDDFNEGDLHKIFGDVYPLLDIKHRNGEIDAQKIVLGKSKETFFVPDNVFILAIADSSPNYKVKLDIKTRSLFKINYVSPNPNDINVEYVEGINLPLLLKNLNNKIDLILGRDYTFGQNFFYRIDSFEKLKNVFYTQFIPALESYTYQDEEKLFKILGTAFFIKTKIGDTTYNKLKSIDEWDETMFKNL